MEQQEQALMVIEQPVDLQQELNQHKKMCAMLFELLKNSCDLVDYHRDLVDLANEQINAEEEGLVRMFTSFVDTKRIKFESKLDLLGSVDLGKYTDWK